MIQTRASLRLDSLGRPSYYSRAVDRSLSGSALQTNVWYLLTSTHEGSLAKLYVNGSMVAETNSFGTLAGPSSTWGLSGWPLPFQDVPTSFAIGSWSDYCGFPGCIFDGLLDDVRFYNRALSAAEIKGLYETTTQPSWDLSVCGVRGDSVPIAGNHSYIQDSVVTATVQSPVVDGTTRYVCEGAEVDGNAFSQSGPTNVTLTLTNSATLTWNWTTQYRLETPTEGEGSVSAASGWLDAGTNIVLTATANSGAAFLTWKGDTNGCLTSGNTVTVPITQARSITAVFSSTSTPPASGLQLWNRLGDTNEVLHSSVGSGGTLTAGRFVPGHFGNALELNMQEQFGCTFPIQTLTTPVGCLEFWAKLSDFPASMPNGASPGLIGWGLSGKIDGYVLFFSANDGAADGGLCARTSFGSVGTGLYGSWTYSKAIGGGNISDWHHYAVTWSTNGIPGVADGSRRVATYVDGSLNSTHGPTASASKFLDLPSTAIFGLLNHQGIVNGRVAFDNLKVWNFAKTDFGDRFVEDSGSTQTYLSVTVGNARGDSAPANGTHSYVYGDTVTAQAPADVTEGGTRYVCTGATVEGNAFTQSGTTNVTLTLTNNATLTWNWKTQYLLETQTEGVGTLTPAEPWQDADATVVLTASPTNGWMFAGWADDTNGCLIAGNVLTAPMTQARLITGLFKPIVVLSLDAFARLPQNVAFKFRRLTGTWTYSNLIGGLFCDSPKPRGTANFQITVSGPGLLTFEWELPGADGTNTLTCAVGSGARSIKKSGAAESVSVAIPSGVNNVSWVLKRGSGSPEVSAIIRNILWTPLEKASAPLPGSGSVLPQRLFSGVSWSGMADSYRVYAGRSSKALKPIGTGVYAGTGVPADAFKELIALAAGAPLYWRVDAVLHDSFGVEAVNPGTVWNVAVLPQGAPEFESALTHVASFKVGVFGELTPLAFLNGIPGTMKCELAAGTLPPGMSLQIRGGAVVVTGVPSKQGRYQASVKLSVKPIMQATVPGTTRMLDLTVTELGAAAGTFDGWLTSGSHGEGTVKMSVTSKGQITGKFTPSGKTYTFVAPSYGGQSNDCCLVQLDVKQGVSDSFPVAVAIGTDGQVSAVVNDEPEANLSLYRNRWLDPGADAFILPYAGEYHVALPASGVFPDAGGEIAFTITSRSRESVSVIGTTANGKRFVSSGTLLNVPGEEAQPDSLFLVVYVTPTAATERKGLFGVLEITHDPAGVEPNGVAEIVPLNWW